MPSSCTLGFHCSHEQLPPSALLRIATLATEAGFSAAMCSDHFHPWSDRQGQSGFLVELARGSSSGDHHVVRNRLRAGAALPSRRVAQAAATLSEMFPDRFWLAVGSGEALNESITGQPWPPKTERNLRLHESVRIIRALWEGESVTTRGAIVTEAARLYSSL